MHISYCWRYCTNILAKTKYKLSIRYDNYFVSIFRYYRFPSKLIVFYSYFPSLSIYDKEIEKDRKEINK